MERTAKYDGVLFDEMFPVEFVNEARDCYESHRQRGFTVITSLATTLALVDGHATPGLRRNLARWLQANTKGTDMDDNDDLISLLDML